jgi:GH25 family lysozyme M1 (1,4-beta-N-acetylmuramidase)
MTSISDKYKELLERGIAANANIDITEVAILDRDGNDTGATSFTFEGSNSPVSIFQHPTFGVNEVYGAVLEQYNFDGGPTGVLGFPITGQYDDIVGEEAVGRTNEFQNGLISWNEASGITSETVEMSFSSGNSLEFLDGIDVSVFQGKIDWNKVAGEGTSDGQVISFAYMKASEGEDLTDGKFADNAQNSKGLLPRGAYHYLHARASADQTLKQADQFLKIINKSDYGLELPPMVDVEQKLAGVTAEQAAESLNIFMAHVEEALGVRPIIYTFPSYWKFTMLDSDRFSNSHKLWIANYGAKRSDNGYEMPKRPMIPGKWSQFSIWQHSVKPGVSGISGLVDRNTVVVPSGQSIAEFLKQ